jgi:hypothetical protein
MFTQSDLDVADDALEQCRRLVERQHEIVRMLAGNPEFQSLAREVLVELEATLERRRRYRDGMQTLLEAEMTAAKTRTTAVAPN